VCSLSSYEFGASSLVFLVILQSVSFVLESSYSILATIVSIWIYSLLYMFDDYRLQDFLGFIVLFGFSMLGFLCFRSLIVIHISWELIGYLSFLLISF